MAEIKVETTINASKETIWEQLTDLNNFSRLSKHIEYASGRMEKGSRLKARLNIRGVRVPVVVWVHDIEKNRKFSWGGPSGKLLSIFF
jgi:ligand-binding SRPBCC domain-containing protein